MLIINVCTVCFFMDAMASVKLGNNSLFNKKMLPYNYGSRLIIKNRELPEGLKS